MKKSSHPARRLKLGLGIALLAFVSGCVGYVDPGYGPVVVRPWYGGWFYDGFYDGGTSWHDYGHRGFESRGIAHGGGHGGRR